jgi:hypothetical protein
MPGKTDMTTKRRHRIVLANAVNYVVEVNDILNNATRRGEVANLVLPSMFDRAFLVFHEAGTLPFTDTLYTAGGNK